MSNIDVVARLQLNAQQFSSETAARFADMKTRAKSAAQEVRDSFSSSFAEVQKLAQNALNVPLNKSGALDLSSEIAQLNEAATASERRAVALRELSIAQTAASQAAGVDAEALRLEADASAVAALAAEQDASTTRDRISALEIVQTKLNETTSATERMAVETRRASTTSGGFRIGMQQLGFQIGDVSQELTLGISPMTVFAQQGGQVIQALGMMTNEAKGFLGFMGGPWGQVITAGLIVATPFVAKLIDMEGALKADADALEKAAKSTDVFGEAQSLLGKVIDLNTGKLKTHNEALIAVVRSQALLMKLEGVQDQADAKKALLEQGRGYDLGLPGLHSVSTTIGEAANLLRGGVRGAGRFEEIDKQSDIASLARGVADGSIDLDTASKKLVTLADTGKITADQLTKATQAFARFATDANKVTAGQEALDALNGKGIAADLVPYSSKKTHTKKTPDLTRMSESAAETIARINAEWDRQPSLVDKANVETLKLDNLVKDLERRKPPGYEKLIADAKAAGQAIRDGMTRPFQDFVQAQRQGLSVQQLILQGHDAEAAALQSALRIQQQQGALYDGELQSLLSIAEQQERISRALEDQRRVVNIYVGAIDDMQRTFGQFLDDLQAGTGSAFKSVVSGLIADVRHLQSDLVSNALFGGIDRDIADYIRQMTGKKTPAEILSDQATDAGKVLNASATSTGNALDRLTKAFLGAAERFDNAPISSLTGPSPASANDNLPASPELLAMLAKGNGITDADATPDIVVTATRLKDSAGILDRVVLDLGENLRHFGIELPKEVLTALQKGLPTVIEGLTYGGVGGSIFSAITGGKNDKLASSIGGILGDEAGKALSKPIGDLIGGTLGKTLGGAAGPIGSVLGGILGNVIGGLFHSAPHGASTISSDQYGNLTASAGFGNNATAVAAAEGEAQNVIQGLQQIADALGANITGGPNVTIGTYNGEYRVNPNGYTKLGGGGGKLGNVNFGDDQQAAIAYAIQLELQRGVITGISQASVNILKEGKDLQSAIQKAVLIEGVPKELKEMLDPVGAAVDAVNEKFAKIVAALKEGHASAEQMAQAQQLYNLELDQAKNSTAAADQTLKDFITSLHLGSNSPYSLRDQEGTALQQLQPFLDQINAGQSIDQEKYQSAAQAYLDVERQLYGSTDKYFDALDSIQAATNKAIETIDNAAPIASSATNPFGAATADSTAQTAKNTQTGNEMTQQTNELLSRIASRLDTLTSPEVPSPFIGVGRGFVAAA